MVLVSTPAYFYDGEALEMLWPIPLSSAVMAVLFTILSVAFVPFNLERNRFYLLGLFTFSFMGFSSGFLSGISRESVLGDVIPAILAVFGALVVYLVQQKDTDRYFVCGVVLCMSSGLLIGSIWGAQARAEYFPLGDAPFALPPVASILSKVT